MTLLIGTAGWSLPSEAKPRFPGEGTHLERYARVFPCVEINSTFYRPHRASTFARWAASVPASFRFALKVPKTITHEAGLAGTRSLVDAFLADIEPLGAAADCLLVQLPPKLEFEARLARGFFSFLRDRFPRSIAFEPRHTSWFTPAGERLLRELQIARVAADPPRAPGGDEPGGWDGLHYYRLHGSPRVYYSPYDAGFLDGLAGRIARSAPGTPTWCIFDNTALGAATSNALELMDHYNIPMATYQVWADIAQLAPDKFFVTVSAVPKDERTHDRTGGVKVAEAKTLEEAHALRDAMVLEVGKGLRARGHVILDLIDDSKV